MRPLRLALLADGNSDRALIPIVRWHVHRTRPALPLGEIAFEARGGRPLFDCMRQLIERERPDIIIVHRDAERALLQSRRDEIPDVDCPVVRLVPVRMTETWLLLDETAIRRAARNPNGRVEIRLPNVNRLEAIPNPKETLHELLVKSSELKGPRRTKRFKRDLPAAVHVVADSIEDFSPLNRLPAFRTFMNEFEEALGKARPVATGE